MHIIVPFFFFFCEPIDLRYRQSRFPLPAPVLETVNYDNNIFNGFVARVYSANVSHLSLFPFTRKKKYPLFEQIIIAH